MLKKLSLFFLRFSLAMAQAYAGPGGSGQAPSNVAKPPSLPMGIKNAMSATSPADPAYQIWIDAKQVNVSETGKVRSFYIKDGVHVARDQFFGRYGANLGLKENDQVVEFMSHQDADGLVQSRFQQKYKGIEVIGGGYVLQEKDGTVIYAIGDFATDLNLDVTPIIMEDKALDAALYEIGADTYDWEDQDDPAKTEPKGQIVITSKDFTYTKDSYRPVYRFAIGSKKPFGSETVEIDIKTGEVVNRFSNLIYTDVGGLGETSYNGEKPIVVDEFTAANETFYRLRMKGPPEVWTSIMHPTEPAAKDYVSTKPHFKTPPYQPGASAHWAIQKAIAFFKGYGWLGWDGSGQVPIEIFIVPPTNSVNGMAFHSAAKLYFQEFNPMAASLDVAGHEFTHGIFSYLTKSVSSNIGEKGAIDEGFGDIMGTLIEYRTRGVLDWCLGEDLKLPKKCVRFLDDPKMDGTTASRPLTYQGPRYLPSDKECGPEKGQNDHCHVNSSILTRWFHLMVQGGNGEIEKSPNDKPETYSVSPIGIDDAQQIAVSTLLLMFGNPTFQSVKDISLFYAESKFGRKSDQYKAARNAWHAVGLGSPYDNDAERLCTPASGSIGVDNWPATLSCEVFPDEIEWEFQVSTSPAFDKDVKSFSSNFLIFLGPGMTTTRVTLNLDAKAPYFWRMKGKKSSDPSPSSASPASVKPTESSRGIKGLFQRMSPGVESVIPREASPAPRQEAGDGWGNWSPIQFLTTDSKTPTPKAPTSVAPVQPWAVEFSWTPVASAEGYVVEAIPSCQNDQPAAEKSKSAVVSWMEGYFKAISTCKTVIGTVGKSKTTAILKLKKLTDYGWRVRAFGPDGAKGDWSLGGGTLSFTTTDPKVDFESPGEGASVAPWDIFLKWKSIPGAVGYTLVASKNSDLSNPFIPQSGIIGTSAGPYHLSSSNDPYFWGVLPIGPGNEEGAWSKRSFKVDYQKTKVSLWPHEPVPFKSKNVVVKWGKVPGAKSYSFSFQKKGGGSPILTGSFGIPCISNTPNVLCHDLGSGTSFSEDPESYCVTVEAMGPGDAIGVPSDPMCYQIAPPFPTLLAPAYYQKNTPYPTQLDWKCDFCGEYKPDGFVVHWKDDAAEKILNRPYSGAPSYGQMTPTSANKGYWWWVCVLKGGLQTCSGPSIFWTKAEASKPPPQQQQAPQSCYDLGETAVTNLPACSSAQFSYNLNCNVSAGASGVAFTWNPVAGAKNYQVEITAPGLPGILSKTISQGTQSSSIPLNYWMGYVVNVRVINACDQLGSIQGKGKGFYLVP